MMSKQILIFWWLLLVLLISCTSNGDPNLPSSTPVVTSIPTSVASISITIEATRPSETSSPPIATPSPIPLNTATSTPEPTPLPAFLNVVSQPEGALLAIAEAELAVNTPYSTELPSGLYTVSVSLEGYQNWEENFLFQAGETYDLAVNLVANPGVAGQYITLAELGSASGFNEQRYLADITWEPEQNAFVYAMQEGVGYREAKDWTWSRFDLLNRENLALEAPQSLVNSEARVSLNLCPLDEQDWAGPTRCGFLNRLFESDVNDLFLFSPVLEDLYSEGELWIANIDGSDAQKLANFAPSYANWSTDGQWFVTASHFPGLPGQETHFLGATDGSYFETLQRITGIDNFYLNGLFPQFSPTKPELLIAGSQVSESREESDYKLYILDLNTLESRLVTDRVGLFQWADNGQGIYVLDGALLPPSTEPVPVDTRETDLYYIDLTQNPPQEYLIARGIPYYSHTDYGTWNWAYSPTFQAIAYVGFQDETELGVLFLEQAEGNE